MISLSLYKLSDEQPWAQTDILFSTRCKSTCSLQLCALRYPGFGYVFDAAPPQKKAENFSKKKKNLQNIIISLLYFFKKSITIANRKACSCTLRDIVNSMHPLKMMPCECVVHLHIDPLLQQLTQARCVTSRAVFSHFIMTHQRHFIHLPSLRLFFIFALPRDAGESMQGCCVFSVGTDGYIQAAGTCV